MKMHSKMQNTTKIISAIFCHPCGLIRLLTNQSKLESRHTKKSGDIHQEFVKTCFVVRAPANLYFPN
jgi:hypothetical protein